MLPQNCGKLLYNAVRETLETMAFADVVPCSIKVAGEEFAQDDDFILALGTPMDCGAGAGWGDEAPAVAPADAWGTATPAVDSQGDSWADSPEPTSDGATSTGEDWGTPDSTTEHVSHADWGTNISVPAQGADPWGAANLAESVVGGANRPKEADFDAMMALQDDWTWACMRVNSPDVHSVWFIVPQSLARALMENMYAGESVELDSTLVKDLIAELTNVLGGRLMLLLEELGGKFTLTVPDIGFGMPDISEAYTASGVVCKIVVDSEHPIISALRFNQAGVLGAD